MTSTDSPPIADTHRRTAIVICVAAVLLMAMAFALPPMRLFDGRPADLLSVHLLLELFAVVVSLMVVSMAWHTLKGSGQAISNTLLFGFTVVAGADILHAITYEGMPSLLSDSSTSKAIFFWLMGRSAEVATVWLVALGVRLGGSRGQWLVLGLMSVLLLFLFGSYSLHLFPATFVPGQGVTSFKARFEYGLCAANLAAAAVLFWQSRRRAEGQVQLVWLGTASFVMGVGELAFSNYLAPSDFLNVFGHIYKIVAYAFIYRATFIAGVREPYGLLQQSEQRIRGQQRELDTLLRNVPVGVSRLDRELIYRFVNPFHANNLGGVPRDIVGRAIEDILPDHVVSQARPHLIAALSGQRVEFDLKFTNRAGRLVQGTATVVPERNAEGEIDGALAILADTTERDQANQKLVESLREISELKAALDAHAIVAVTDAQGVITRVNDKFCTISRFPRSELIGKTHRIINSGFHPADFFHDLWHTISRGEVWNGEICNRAKDGTLYWVYTTIVPFIGADGLPEQYIAIRADITERKKAEEAAQHMAFYDALTGLPNRRLMAERLLLALQASARSGQYGALLLLDLDQFKEVNDTMGHGQGDTLLKQVGQRLHELVRQTDTVARLGGDEFVVVLGELGTDRTQALSCAGDLGEKVRRRLSERFDFNDFKVDVTASLGVVMFHGDGEHVDELLKQADMALYRAKGAGRNCMVYFDPGLQAEVNARARLLSELRGAIEGEQLRVYYQLVVNGEQEVLGVEALVRWQHPERGMVSPADFIPLAEQAGLIEPIGHWVLETSCRQLVAWADHAVMAGWTIAVNVSARQFHHAGFVDEVRQVLAQTGANPHRLRLELTESMLHADLDETIARMAELQTLGVRFSLDDFGTGYSSLSYLKRLPLDQLKIDRSFVNDVLTDPNDAAIARTILSLADSLGLGVVAEGVETTEQLDFLVQHGCKAFQGYLFGRPVPVEQLAHRRSTLEPQN